MSINSYREQGDDVCKSDEFGSLGKDEVFSLKPKVVDRVIKMYVICVCLYTVFQGFCKPYRDASASS